MVYRAAVVGCGKIGSEFADDPRIKDIYTHAGAYSVCRDTELVAVCDSNPGKLKRCASRWGVKYRFDDINDMLAVQEPEIVSICTPDPTHYELIRTAIASPSVRAVLAEKPLAMRVDEARDLFRMAGRKKVVLAVNYSRRYAGNFQNLRKFLQSGGIGDIQAISGHYGNGTRHTGTHWFDLVRFLVGEIRRVRAFDRLHEAGEDPTLDVHLELDRNIFGYLHGYNSRDFSIFELDIIGTLGRVTISDSGHTMRFHRVADSPYYSGYRSLMPFKEERGGMVDTVLHAVEDLVMCLDTGAEPLCTGRDGIENLKIAEAALNSAKEGRAITMDSE
ncbi:MAG: hypothetical protein APR53_03355 [Methanoculleus sp. SDB]|nr:MAG: hypothetical protein APR53_03355 [Methanoculleus sp. SDB]